MGKRFTEVITDEHYDDRQERFLDQLREVEVEDEAYARNEY